MTASIRDEDRARSYAEALREMTGRYEGLVQQLSVLRCIDELDDPTLGLDTVLRMLAETIVFNLSAENCSIMLVDATGEYLELRAVSSPLEEGGKAFLPGAWNGKRFRIGEGISGRVAAMGRSACVEDVRLDPSFVNLGEGSEAMRSLFCYPLIVQGKTLGVLNLSHPEPGHFSIETGNTLSLIAERVARLLGSHLLHERLKASETHYRLISNEAADGILVLGLDGNILDANPAIERISGIPVESIHAGKRRWEEGLENEAIWMWRSNLEKVLLRRETTLFEYPYRSVDGRIHYLEQKSSPLRRPGDGKLGAICIVRDVTERKESEEEIQKLRTVADQANFGLIAVDLNDRILYINQYHASIHGYCPEEVLGEPATLFHTEDQVGFIRTLINKILNGETVGAEEVWHRHRDGTVFPMLMNGMLIRDPSGKPLYIASSGVDLTERKKAEKEKAILEEQLQRAQKMEAVGQLAGGVAHDFNNLLTGILGSLSLAETCDSMDEINPLLSQAIKAGNQAAALVRQLLTFGRKTPAVRTSTDLPEVINDVLEIIRKTFDRRIEILLEKQDGLSPILGDKGQIHQVLLNLCLNARDALQEVHIWEGREDLRIVISARNQEVREEYCRENAEAVPGRYVCLSVLDTGGGMTPETLRRLFEPFFTTKERGRGTGLGLATAHGIVKQHGGWIHVESELGKGSVFHVYFPAANSGAKQEIPLPLSQNPARGNETILFADDEEALRNLGRAILERYGYRVVLARDGREALNLFLEDPGRFDLTILDVSMPGLSGYELLRRIHEIRPETRVIIASGYTGNESIKTANGDRNFEFIGKPYLPRDLAVLVRNVLDG